MDSNEQGDMQAEPSATTRVFSAIAVAVICICISAVAVFVISSEKKVHDARKALISSIEDRASKGTVRTGIPVVDMAEPKDGLFTGCRNGWCVSDYVPVDLDSIGPQPASSLGGASTVDLANLAQVICTGNHVDAEHQKLCTSFDALRASAN